MDGWMDGCSDEGARAVCTTITCFVLTRRHLMMMMWCGGGAGVYFFTNNS